MWAFKNKKNKMVYTILLTFFPDSLKCICREEKAAVNQASAKKNKKKNKKKGKSTMASADVNDDDDGAENDAEDPSPRNSNITESSIKSEQASNNNPFTADSPDKKQEKPEDSKDERKSLLSKGISQASQALYL